MGVALLAAKAEPFKVRSLNFAEMLSCNVNVLTLIFGYFFQLGIWDDKTTFAMAVFVNAIVALTIAFLAFAVAMDLFPWIRRFIAMVMNHASAADAVEARHLLREGALQDLRQVAADCAADAPVHDLPGVFFSFFPRFRREKDRTPVANHKKR